MLLWSLVGASASILRADQNATKATSIELTVKTDLQRTLQREVRTRLQSWIRGWFPVYVLMTLAT